MSKDINKEIDLTETVELDQVDLGNENLTDNEVRAKKDLISKKAENIYKSIIALPENEREDFQKLLYGELGVNLDEKGLKLSNMAGMTPSDIIKDLGIFVIDQQIKKTYEGYDSRITSTIKWKEYENGVVQKIYQDFMDADNITAYSDVEISDYNKGRTLLTEEHFRATLDIHKGIDLPDIALNDVAKNNALFISMLQDLALSISRPIAKKLYEYALKMIASPLTDLKEGVLDVSAEAPDITITATDIKDALKQLTILIGDGGTLWYTGRDKSINKEWIPGKFTTDLEITPKLAESKTFIPIELDREIRNGVSANTFQLKELNLPEWNAIDYKATFGNYGKVKGLNHTPKNYDLFVIWGEPVEGILQYDLTKTVDTPKAKKVVNHYLRVGKSINKNNRQWKINIKIGA